MYSPIQESFFSFSSTVSKRRVTWRITFLTAFFRKTVTLAHTAVFGFFLTSSNLSKNNITFYITAKFSAEVPASHVNSYNNATTASAMPVRTVLGFNIFSILGTSYSITVRYWLCIIFLLQVFLLLCRASALPSHIIFWHMCNIFNVRFSCTNNFGQFISISFYACITAVIGIFIYLKIHSIFIKIITQGFGFFSQHHFWTSSIATSQRPFFFGLHSLQYLCLTNYVPNFHSLRWITCTKNLFSPLPLNGSFNSVFVRVLSLQTLSAPRRGLSEADMYGFLCYDRSPSFSFFISASFSLASENHVENVQPCYKTFCSLFSERFLKNIMVVGTFTLWPWKFFTKLLLYDDIKVFCGVTSTLD